MNELFTDFVCPHCGYVLFIQQNKLVYTTHMYAWNK